MTDQLFETAITLPFFFLDGTVRATRSRQGHCLTTAHMYGHFLCNQKKTVVEKKGASGFRTDISNITLGGDIVVQEIVFETFFLGL